MVDYPLDSPDRLEAVRKSGLLNTDRDGDFARLSNLAARILGTPAAFVTILDDRQQLLKSASGELNGNNDLQGVSQGLYISA